MLEWNILETSVRAFGSMMPFQSDISGFLFCFGVFWFCFVLSGRHDHWESGVLKSPTITVLGLI